MQLDSIPFTRELLKILKDIPKEQWDLLSIPGLIQKVKQNLEQPTTLEVSVADKQQITEKLQ